MEQGFIEIMDTTLRDGEQTNGVSFLPHEKLMIARMLLGNLNVDRIEVASARVSEGEKEAVKMWQKVMELDPDFLSKHNGETELQRQLKEKGLIE